MLSCKEVVARADDYVDRNLGWREKLAVRLHLFLCSYCRRYVRQLRLLIAALRLRGRAATEEEVAAVMRKIEDDEHRH
ncbi:MAG: zf-HC2 domain-containing protein [Gammaproteobacteria bacterium]|nr:zf-HC2 domain-containing protein [Gammaproteobacteria bacterium]